jgi:hypothetical protein
LIIITIALDSQVVQRAEKLGSSSETGRKENVQRG